MYHSRLHFENEKLHLALDGMTGEILELCDKSGENLVKNSMFDFPQPFEIHLRLEDRTVSLSAPHSRDALETPAIRAEISSEETENGICVTVHYPCLTDGKERYPLSFTYTATLKAGEIHWDSRLHNSTDGTVTWVRFPILNGVWLGEDFESNTLYYPRYAGERYENPVKALSEEPCALDWRWQEYRYQYFLSGVVQSSQQHERGLRGVVLTYPGEASMSYMALCDESRSLYFGCHDPEHRRCYMEAGAIGEKRPGVCLSFRFDPRVYAGESWQTPTSVMTIDEGDWHAAARRYRAFRQPLLIKPKKPPEWMKNNHGLFAHYDFKYQNGGIVHTYRDIPALAAAAKESGLSHILLSGWHKDGFDCGFPMYVPDDELGTKAELVAGICAAREMGVHVTLYMNVRIHNRAYNTDIVDAMAVLGENGSVVAESYGNPHLKFSTMCPKSPLWHKLITEAVRRGTEDYGADGVYLDQIGSGNCACFNRDHGHPIGDWDYTDILTTIRERYLAATGEELCIMGEWPIDVYGPLTDLALNQTFINLKIGGFPAMYRYTFPEHDMTDMVYPTQNLAMRPVHVAQAALDIMGMLFCNGSYFWIYDLEEDNTFSRDPKGFEMLKRLLALARIRKERLPKGLYLDTDGIACDSKALRVSRFSDGEENILCLYTKEDREVIATLTLSDILAKDGYFFDGIGDAVHVAVENGKICLPERTGILLLS